MVEGIEFHSQQTPKKSSLIKIKKNLHQCCEIEIGNHYVRIFGRYTGIPGTIGAEICRENLGAFAEGISGRTPETIHGKYQWEFERELQTTSFEWISVIRPWELRKKTPSGKTILGITVETECLFLRNCLSSFRSYFSRIFRMNHGRILRGCTGIPGRIVDGIWSGNPGLNTEVISSRILEGMHGKHR